MNTQFQDHAHALIKYLRKARKKLSKHAYNAKPQNGLRKETLTQTSDTLDTIITLIDDNTFTPYQEEFIRLLSPFFLYMERDLITGTISRPNYIKLIRGFHNGTAKKQLEHARDAIKHEYGKQTYPWG